MTKRKTAPKKKVASAKKAVSKKVELLKKVVYTRLEADWSKVPVGTKFTGIISGSRVEGRIQKQGLSIYLCQNKRNGSDCANKLGFKYSYNIGNGSTDSLKGNSTTITSLTLDPKFKVPVVLPLIRIGGNAVIFGKKSIAVGCHTVTYEVLKEIYKRAITDKYID